MHCRILKLSQSLLPLRVYARMECGKPGAGSAGATPSALLNCPLTLVAAGIALMGLLWFMATIATAARHDLKAIKLFTVSLSPR